MVLISGEVGGLVLFKSTLTISWPQKESKDFFHRTRFIFQDKKHGSGESDQKKVMVKVGNKTKHTGGAGGKRSVASASLVSIIRSPWLKRST